VISMYKWEQVKRLKRDGYSIRRIARELKVSRNTVKRYLVSEQVVPEYPKRHYESKADPYAEQVKSMLEDQYIGTRIYRELVKLGFEGSQSCIDRYIRRFKKEDRVGEKVTTRFETMPGEQSQYDWKEWTLSVGGQSMKLYFHVLLLGYSRKKHYIFSTSITGEDVIKAMSLGFEAIGGLTSEIVIDNGKQMVITHKKNGVVRFNDEFLKFCGMYGLTPNACQNYRARTKGKCERPFHYLQEQFLRGLEVSDFAELERKLAVFNQEVNQKENRYLKETPNQRFEREKSALKPLPAIEPTILFKRELRKVSFDGYLSWDGKLYAVPMKYSGKTVFIEISMGKSIRVYDQGGEQVASHMKRLDDVYQPTHEEHDFLNEKMKEKKIQLKKSAFKQFVSEYGQIGETFLKGLKETGENMYWQMDEILTFKNCYHNQHIMEALAECIQIGQFRKAVVKNLLSKHKMKTPVLNRNQLTDFPTEPISRSLEYYKLEAANG